MDFKDKLKIMRSSTGLSQQKFGMIFRISAINIANWEQGVTSPPEYVQYMLERLIEIDRSIPRKESVKNV